MGWRAAVEDGEADLGLGSGRERAEWGLGVEAVGGGAMGATASSPASNWGQGPGCRVEGGEESEMGTQASREGAGRVVDEVHGSSGAWPAILGVVASRGWWGAWRVREGARVSGFGRYRGRARRIWPGGRRRRTDG